MTDRLDVALTSLLEDVDTAPDGEPLEDALDALTDWVQVHRAALLAGVAPRELAPAPQPQVVRYVDEAAPILRAYIKLLLADEGVNYIPAAVTKRGNAYIPTAVPDTMTEAQFQGLLEAEADATEERGEPEVAGILRQDLKRRRSAFAAQERRAAQIAALGPAKDRLPIGRAAGL